MFKSISWQEYLYAIGLIVVGYFVFVISVFYTRDILRRLKGTSAQKAKPHYENPAGRNQNFMGTISTIAPKKIPVRESVACAEELTIEANPDELVAANKADSPAAELLERLDDLFLAFKDENVAKSNYLKNIKTLLRQYPQFNDTPTEDEVTGFICDAFRDNAQMNFTIEEITVLWLNEKNETINQSITTNNHEK